MFCNFLCQYTAWISTVICAVSLKDRNILWKLQHNRESILRYIIIHLSHSVKEKNAYRDCHIYLSVPLSACFDL
jgi:hypothetical protein